MSICNKAVPFVSFRHIGYPRSITAGWTCLEDGITPMSKEGAGMDPLKPLGRARRSWREEMNFAMEDRVLQDGEWKIVGVGS